jgi:hypothetical protein
LICSVRNPKRQRAGDQRAGRGAADEVEPVAEPNLLAETFRENVLDALQERDRDRAPHRAAVEREDAFGPRAEQVPVAGAVEGGLFCHRCSPQKRLA